MKLKEGMEENYQKWYDKNEDAYGRACFTYAEKWAELMEEAIDAALYEVRPLVEAGGFIPTVDHTIPPDISLSNFEYYMAQKRLLLEGRLP